MYMVLSKDLFRTLLEEVQKGSWKRFLIFAGLSLHVEHALCPAKIAHQSNAYASLSWCLNQRLKLFHGKHMRKTLASILSEKATAVIKRVRDCRTHPQRLKQRKRRAENLSRFDGTKPVIFKLVISGSNMVEFTPNLVISFLT